MERLVEYSEELQDRDSNSGPSEYEVMLIVTPQNLVWKEYM